MLRINQFRNYKRTRLQFKLSNSILNLHKYFMWLLWNKRNETTFNANSVELYKLYIRLTYIACRSPKFRVFSRSKPKILNQQK